MTKINPMETSIVGILIFQLLAYDLLKIKLNYAIYGNEITNSYINNLFTDNIISLFS